MQVDLADLRHQRRTRKFQFLVAEKGSDVLNVLSRYQSKLNYPMPDSFPRIFRDEDGNAIGDPIGIKTALSTDSSVMDKMKGLRTTVLRSIGLEDRENIGNELAEIAEGYKEGWSSGSDDDDDDE